MHQSELPKNQIFFFLPHSGATTHHLEARSVDALSGLLYLYICCCCWRHCFISSVLFAFLASVNRASLYHCDGLCCDLYHLM